MPRALNKARTATLAHRREAEEPCTNAPLNNDGRRVIEGSSRQLLVNLTVPSAGMPECFHFLREATSEEIGVDVKIIGGLKIEPELG